MMVCMNDHKTFNESKVKQIYLPSKLTLICSLCHRISISYQNMKTINLIKNDHQYKLILFIKN